MGELKNEELVRRKPELLADLIHNIKSLGGNLETVARMGAGDQDRKASDYSGPCYFKKETERKHR